MKMDDDLQILTLPYNNDLYAIYNKTNNLKVLILLALHYLTIVINWILCFLLPIQQHNFNEYLQWKLQLKDTDFFNSFNLTVFSQIVLWLFTLLIRCYLKCYYYRRLRILGYNNHHDKVKKHVLLPSFILHLANALLLLATVFLNHFDHIQLWNFHLKPVNAAEVIISISSLAMLINIKFHMYHEIKFRRVRNPPDVFCVDDPSRRLTTDGLNQVAIRSSSFLEDLLENQADMIYNLKLQNTHLRELLFKATQQQQQNDNQSSRNSQGNQDISN